MWHLGSSSPRQLLKVGIERVYSVIEDREWFSLLAFSFCMRHLGSSSPRQLLKVGIERVYSVTEDREGFSLHTDGAHRTSAFSWSLVLLALLRTWASGVLFLTERLHYWVTMLRVRLLTKRQLYIDLRVCLLTHKHVLIFSGGLYNDWCTHTYLNCKTRYIHT